MQCNYYVLFTYNKCHFECSYAGFPNDSCSGTWDESTSGEGICVGAMSVQAKLTALLCKKKKKPMVRDKIYYERSDKKTFLIDMAMIAVNVSSKLHFTAVFLPFFSLLYNFPLALRMFEVQSILNFSAPSLSLKIWMTSLAR